MQSNGEIVVQLTGVHKRFGKVEALKGIDLTIRQGEVVAMLGPNGAGKTTSISLILGLRRPSAGTVRLFGQDPSDRAARSRTGVMLQESGIPTVLTVMELVDTFRSLYPRPLPAETAIAMAGLQEQAHQQAGGLSGGQRQRLYFALAIAGDPDVVFLDEPSVGMDVKARLSFLDSVGDFIGRGKTVVLTTHYLEEADQLARRIVLIDRGQVIADGTPAEIKSKVAGKRISFHARDPLTMATLAGLDVHAVSVADHHVSMLSNEPDTVLRELYRRGLETSDIEVVGANLEEAFLALTGQKEKVR
jgi:ABC-2 type transport system ATP-binding protein